MLRSIVSDKPNLNLMIKNLIFSLLFTFILISCGAKKTDTPRDYPSNSEILDSIDGNDFTCEPKANADLINHFHQDQEKFDSMLEQLEMRINEESDNLGYNSFYSELVTNCDLSNIRSKSGDLTIFNTDSSLGYQASIKPGVFKSTVNNFRIEAEPDSLLIEYDSLQNIETVSLNLILVHNYTSVNPHYPIIISNIKISDDQFRRALYSQDKVSNWIKGVVNSETPHKFIYRLVAPYEVVILPLEFKLKKYNNQATNYYDLSLTFYGHKLTLRINPELEISYAR